MTTCTQSQSHHFHTFPLILTSHSFAFPLILLDSRCIFTSVTSLLSFLPSICPTLAEPILTKLLLVLQFHSLSCLTCCRAKPGTVHYLLQKKEKNNYRETPALLKLTVSFPASFLLNTKRTLLAFLIINSQGSTQQEWTACLFSFQPKITPDDFTYSDDFSQRVREEEPNSGSTCCTLIEIKTCRLSAPCMIVHFCNTAV